jgi:hypothetical protein
MIFERLSLEQQLAASVDGKKHYFLAELAMTTTEKAMCLVAKLNLHSCPMALFAVQMV